MTAILNLLQVAVVVTEGTVPPDGYWRKVLPDTAMPRALQHLLPGGCGI